MVPLDVGHPIVEEREYSSDKDGEVELIEEAASRLAGCEQAGHRRRYGHFLAKTVVVMVEVEVGGGEALVYTSI